MKQVQERIVYCEDAIQWLERSLVLNDSSLVASLPDISEFSGMSLEQWKEWFINTARLILSRTSKDGVTIFYQSDIKVDGVWIDKGYLCQKAAELEGHALLWHKIGARVTPGNTTFGRPAYSHILCFGQNVRADAKHSTADILPDLGVKTWERGMGYEACRMIAKFILEQTNTRTVINPFCGQGSMLVAANAVGLSAIGIERSAKRAEMARSIKLVS